MATFTSRLGLRKPDPDPSTGDNVNVQTDLNDNLDKLDSALGAVSCTSSARPSNPFVGQIARETDTGFLIVCTATPSTWMYVGRALKSRPSYSATKVVAEIANNSTTFGVENELQISVGVIGEYRMTGFLLYDSSATADLAIRFIHTGSSTKRWAADGPSISNSANPTFDMKLDDAEMQFSGFGTTGSFRSIHLFGYVNFTTSGTFRLEFRQVTLDAAASTRFLRGSWITLDPV